MGGSNQKTFHFISIQVDELVNFFNISRSKSLIYVIDGDPELPFTPLEQFNIIRNHLAEYDDEIIRELREIQLSQSELADRFNNYQINETVEGKLNRNLQEVPFIVVVTKTDLDDFDQSDVDELNVALQSYNGDNLYYPKVMQT